MTDVAGEVASAFAKAWAPPEDLSPAEWGERYRILSDRVTSEPGPLRLSRTPYARGVLDALGGAFTEVYLQSAAQVCKSEIGRTWMGWSVDQDPGPFLIVFPTEKAAQETLERAVKPMFRDSPKLAAHMTTRAWDVTSEKIELDTCTIDIGWAGGPTTLAAQPKRRVLLDEVNKYPPYRGGSEGSAIAKARKRTQVFGPRGHIYAVSTPTTLKGAITLAVDACVDRRDWHVPCPSCGAMTKLAWDQVQWPGKDATDGDRLHEQLAALEAGLLEVVHVCGSCKHRMTDAERWPAICAGEWISEGYGRGERPASRTVGFRLSGLCSPWTGFAQLAHRFVAAKLKDLGELVAFYNEDLGVPFGAIESQGEKRLVEIPPAVLHRKIAHARSADFQRDVVPSWATHLVGAADPGKTRVPFGVRAFGPGYRSILVAAGEASDLDALDDLVINRPFACEDGDSMLVRLMTIDVGGTRTTSGGARTDEIYRWSAKRSAVVRPTKGFGGAGLPSRPLVTQSHQYRPPGQNSRPYDVTLSTQDTEYFKDLTVSRVLHEDDCFWQIGCVVPIEYLTQVCAEEKRLVERRVRHLTGEETEVWRWAVRIPGAPNHFFDVEVLLTVGAYMLDLDRVGTPTASAPADPPPRRLDRYGRPFHVGQR